MVCDEKYVRFGDECVECDAAKTRNFYFLLGTVGLLCLGVVGLILPRMKDKDGAKQGRDVVGKTRMAAFTSKAQTKYKIVVTFTQILSKMATIYPMDLPPNFTSYQAQTNPFAFLDVDLVPFSCVVEFNFHKKLLVMTLFPFAFIALVGFLFSLSYCQFKFRFWRDRPRLQKELGVLHSRCVYIIIIVVYSVFPLVSAAVFQTFAYDDRLEDSLDSRRTYLKADYSIETSASEHQVYVLYACVMLVVYCAGVPTIALVMLWNNKDAIKKLQTNECKISNIGIEEERIHCQR